MKHRWWRCALVSIFAAVSILALGQGRSVPDQGSSTGQHTGDTHLPNGKLQRDEILKEEHEQNVKDAAQLAELAQQLQQDLDKEDRFVLSMSTLKKTEEIEKLAHKIHSRLRHN